MLLPSWTSCWDGSPPPPLETLGRRWHDVPPRSQHEVHAWEAVAGGEVTRVFMLELYRMYFLDAPRRALGCVKDGFTFSVIRLLCDKNTSTYYPARLPYPSNPTTPSPSHCLDTVISSLDSLASVVALCEWNDGVKRWVSEWRGKIASNRIDA